MDKVTINFQSLTLNNETERNTSDTKKISATKTFRERREIIEELCSSDTENSSRPDSVAPVNNQDSEDEDFDDFEKSDDDDDNESDTDFDTKTGNKKDALELLIEANKRNVINEDLIVEQLRNCYVMQLNSNSSQDKELNIYNTFCKLSPEGLSPLLIAAFCNMTRVSEFLVNQIYCHAFPSHEEARTYLNQQDSEGNTLIHEMAYMGDRVAPTLEMLLKFQDLYYGRNITLFNCGLKNNIQDMPIHFSLRSCLERQQYKTIAIFHKANPDLLKAPDGKGHNVVQFLIKICLKSYPFTAHYDRRDLETVEQYFSQILSYSEMYKFVATSLELLTYNQARIQPAVYSKIHSCLKDKEEDGIQILPMVIITKNSYKNQKAVTLSKRDENMEIPLVVQEFNQTNSPTLSTAHLKNSQHSLPSYSQVATQYSQNSHNPPALYSQATPASHVSAPCAETSSANSVFPQRQDEMSEYIETYHIPSYASDAQSQITPSFQPPIPSDPMIYNAPTTQSLVTQNVPGSYPQTSYAPGANFSSLHPLVTPSQLTSTPAMSASFAVSYTQVNQTYPVNTITAPETIMPATGRYQVHNIANTGEENLLIDQDILGADMTTFPRGGLEASSQFTTLNLSDIFTNEELMTSSQITVNPPQPNVDVESLLEDDLNTYSQFTTLSTPNPYMDMKTLFFH